MVNQGWTCAADLDHGGKVKLSDGTHGTIERVEIIHLTTPVTVYNFEVENMHTYYVGEQSVLVHNDCSKAADAADDVEWNGALKDACDAADNYNLSDDVLDSHIIERHGSQSSYTNKSTFTDDFDILQGIDDTLTGSNSTITSNTNGRSGYIFKQAYEEIIGYSTSGNPLNTIKVVINDIGEVITAFPVN